MLGPQEDWQEYEYRVASGNGVGTFDEPNARVWRITATSTAVPGVINLSTAPPDPTVDVITLAANATLVLEPRGMFPCGAVTFDVAVGPWYVEWIRKRQ